MIPDIGLIKTTLQVLFNNANRDDLTEEIIGIDLGVILHKPLAGHQIAAALAYCRNKSWAREAQDDFGLPVWAITEEGKRILAKP